MLAPFPSDHKSYGQRYIYTFICFFKTCKFQITVLILYIHQPVLSLVLSYTNVGHIIFIK